MPLKCPRQACYPQVWTGTTRRQQRPRDLEEEEPALLAAGAFQGLGTSRRAAAATGHWCLLSAPPEHPDTVSRALGMPRSPEGRGRDRSSECCQGIRLPAVGTGAGMLHAGPTGEGFAAVQGPVATPVPIHQVEERSRTSAPGWPSLLGSAAGVRIWDTPAQRQTPLGPVPNPVGAASVRLPPRPLPTPWRRVTRCTPVGTVCVGPCLSCLPACLLHVWGRNHPSAGGTALSCGLCQPEAGSAGPPDQPRPLLWGGEETARPERSLEPGGLE